MRNVTKQEYKLLASQIRERGYIVLRGAESRIFDAFEVLFERQQKRDLLTERSFLAQELAIFGIKNQIDTVYNIARTSTMRGKAQRVWLHLRNKRDTSI